MSQAAEESGLELYIAETPDNKLLVRHNKFGDSASFSVTSSVAGILSDDANIAQKSESGINIEGTINDEVTLGEGQMLTTLEGMEAEGITIKYDRVIGLINTPILNETGELVGTELTEEKNEDIVGGPNNPKIEGYVHVSQMSKEFQVGLDKTSNPTFSFATSAPVLWVTAFITRADFLALQRLT